MAFSTTTYKVMIASPSDMKEEREEAKAALNDWNDLHSEAEGINLLPIMWETHATPETGVRPQEAINRQLVDPSDILIGMFWSKIGTNTGIAESGTVEEIDRATKTKPVMLYFSRIPIDPTEIDVDQHKRLSEFKANILSKALVGTFDSLPDLRKTLLEDLTRKIRELKKVHISAVDNQGQNSLERARHERKAYEEKLISNTYYDFRAKYAIFATSLTSVDLPKTPLKLDKSQQSLLMKYFHPPSLNNCPIRFRPKSITSSDDSSNPKRMTELTNNGTVYSAWNLGRGRDGDHPSTHFPNYQIDPSKQWVLHMNNSQPELIKALQHWLIGLKELGLNGPWYFSLSMFKVKNCVLSPSIQFDYYNYLDTNSGYENDHMESDTFLIPADADLTTYDAIELLVSPPFKELWRHCGYSSTPLYAPKTVAGYSWAS